MNKLRYVDARWLKRNLQYSSYNETYSADHIYECQNHQWWALTINTYRFRRSIVSSPNAIPVTNGHFWKF